MTLHLVLSEKQSFSLQLQNLDTKDLKLETHLEHCSLAFTSLDTLNENNKFICQSCFDRKYDIIMVVFHYFYVAMYTYVCS